VRSALVMWGRSGPSHAVFILRAGFRLWMARRRRARLEAKTGMHIPTVVALSPTMRCNYDCRGCYSRGRSTRDELSTLELDSLLSEAEDLGVLAVVVTGGEPFTRPDLVDLIRRHRQLLFVIITNGSLVTAEGARLLRQSGNAIVLVSLEGHQDNTDGRRGPGAHEAALLAMGRLADAGAPFGFAATNTAENSAELGREEFIDEMISHGCSLGFFSEYVPCDPCPNPGWVLEEEARERFRQQVLDLRGRKPIVLVQFPHDEYGKDNRCSAAGQASLHINSQGFIEPCPFVSRSCENIREGGLRAALDSAFLRSIRERPHLLQRQRFACSLFEHLDEIEDLARAVESSGNPDPGEAMR